MFEIEKYSKPTDWAQVCLWIRVHRLQPLLWLPLTYLFGEHHAR
jgi:hypothetical protein